MHTNLKKQYSSNAATGSTLLKKNALTDSPLVIRNIFFCASIIQDKMGRTQGQIYSSSWCFSCSCSCGTERRASTFCLIVSYSWTSLLAVRYSASSESFFSVSAASSFSMRSAEGTGTAPSFFSSLAAASNKMISLSWPRRNFSLSLDWR